jgi:hypothetical protein
MIVSLYNILSKVLQIIIKVLEYDSEDVKTKNNNSYSKFAIALQGEIERRKLDKNPIKFKLQRKVRFVSKLEIALKEVLRRRGKIQAS